MTPSIDHAIRRFAFAAALTLAPQLVRGTAAPCPGDCNADGTVSIDELVQAVGIALGSATIDRCTNADANADGSITVDELVRAVNSALLGCPDPGDGPDLIEYDSLNLQPEGIEYDEVRGRFLVGSSTNGVIRAVSDDGELTTVIAEPGLGSSLGIHIDRGTDRLLVPGTLTGSATPALGIYDLTDGSTLHLVDLSEVAGPGPHLVNDVVNDSQGNAYVTDTLGSAVYRVDPDGNAIRFAEGSVLGGANGIELYDDRILLVATLGGPSLLRIALDDPQTIGSVDTLGPVSGDGVAFAPDGDLVLVGGLPMSGGVYRLRSDDDWQSAGLAGVWDASTLGYGTPTTVAIRGPHAYVSFAHLFQTTVSRYQIGRAEFR